MQPDPAFVRKVEVQRRNGHQRFEEEENMEEKDEDQESMSAEAMKALYSQSVSVALLPSPAPTLIPSQSKADQPAKSITGGSVSCEEALLASLDQRSVSNQGMASKTNQHKSTPRVVFRPRALDVAQLKQQHQADNGATSRYKMSTSTTAPSGMEALLSCQGQVFAKDGSERTLNNGTVNKEKDYSSFPPLVGVP